MEMMSAHMTISAQGVSVRSLTMGNVCCAMERCDEIMDHGVLKTHSQALFTWGNRGRVHVLVRQGVAILRVRPRGRDESLGVGVSQGVDRGAMGKKVREE